MTSGFGTILRDRTMSRTVFRSVSEFLHLAQTEKAAPALDGMCRPKDFVDQIFVNVGPGFLDGQQVHFHVREMFTGLRDEFLYEVILAYPWQTPPRLTLADAESLFKPHTLEQAKDVVGCQDDAHGPASFHQGIVCGNQKTDAGGIDDDGVSQVEAHLRDSIPTRPVEDRVSGWRPPRR